MRPAPPAFIRIVAMALLLTSCINDDNPPQVCFNEVKNFQYKAPSQYAPIYIEALEAVKSKGLTPAASYNEDDVAVEISEYSDFTKFIYTELQDNKCGLGDYNNVARLNMFPSLCSDLDIVGDSNAKTKERRKALKHAIWMCELLTLPNLGNFLEYLQKYHYWKHCKQS